LLAAAARPPRAVGVPARAKPPPLPLLALLLLLAAAARSPDLYASLIEASAPQAIKPGTDIMAMEAAMCGSLSAVVL
jgi:hypothetical protein